MKKITLMLVAMLAAFAANAWTVKFTNPDNWTDVAVWAWVDGGSDCFTSWPGASMTESDGVYTYVSTDGIITPTKIKFSGMSNGSRGETGNFDFVDGATYDKAGVVGAEKQKFTLSFKNTGNWGSVYVYTWNPEYCGGWPGKELTADENGIYSFTFEAQSLQNDFGFKFSDKGGSQTGNLKYVEGAIYNAQGVDVSNQSGDNEESKYNGYWINLGTDSGDSAAETHDDKFDQLNANLRFYPGFQLNDGNTVAKFEDKTLGNGKFVIKVWDGGKDHFYATSSPVEAGVETALEEVEQANSFMTIKDAIAGDEYDVDFNMADKKLLITYLGNSTAVATIEAANGEAVYFNMQGVRVANPENGLFIRVQNGKAVKVVK